MGMQIVESITNDRISGKPGVLAIEKRLGGELLADYLDFLVKWNGGRPKPSVFAFQEMGRTTNSEVQCFFGVCDDRNYGLRRNLDIYEGRIPTGYCPIACDPLGNLLLLGVVGSSRGAVYFWDHERETGEPTMANMSKVANCFTEFLSILK